MSGLTPEEEKRRREILGQKEPLRVEVDTTQVSEKMEELIKAKVEAEAKLESKIEIDIGKDVIEKLKLRADELGIEYDEPKNREDFEALAYVVAKTQREMNRPPPSGSIPLSDRQMGQIAEEEGFDTYEDMINYIRDRASQKESEKEANEILNELWKKALKTQEDTNKTFSYEEKSEKSIAEQINERIRRRREKHE